ncbi:MAG TPA: hypothetical protein VMG30_12925 [Acidobacteriota bacterium]|nr:hypothetical protein [Acidobacteriota bacterium]
MQTSIRVILLAVSLNIVFAIAGQDTLKAEPAIKGPSCDRECLRGFITKYLDALIAHKPGDVPVAPKARFTENTVEVKLGGGPLESGIKADAVSRLWTRSWALPGSGCISAKTPWAWDRKQIGNP